jgi:hypothetical protein
LNKLERRIEALESKRGKSRCGECVNKPCPANLDCPMIFFDQLIQEAERRRQSGDREFARMVLKAIGKSEPI